MAGAAMMVQPAVSLSEAQAFVRIETGEEEALLAGFVRTASAVCESFLNQIVVARGFEEVLDASAEWKRLSCVPVRSIDSVETLDAAGIPALLPPTDYEVDVDVSGHGWVRLRSPVPARRLRVGGTAGLAAEPNGVPEPIRQGVLRLVAHLFGARDGRDAGPPAAVTALWRPYRRMHLR